MNLPLPEAVILKALQQGGPLSASEICRVVRTTFHHDLKRSSVYRYLRNLEERGLICVCPETAHPELWETVERQEQAFHSIGEIANALVESLKVREEEAV